MRRAGDCRSSRSKRRTRLKSRAFGFTFFETASTTHGVEKVVDGIDIFRNWRKVAEQVTFQQGELLAFDERLELRGGKASNRSHDSDHDVAGFQ